MRNPKIRTAPKSRKFYKQRLLEEVSGCNIFLSQDPWKIFKADRLVNKFKDK